MISGIGTGKFPEINQTVVPPVNKDTAITEQKIEYKFNSATSSTVLSGLKGLPSTPMAPNETEARNLPLLHEIPRATGPMQKPSSKEGSPAPLPEKTDESPAGDDEGRFENRPEFTPADIKELHDEAAKYRITPQ